MIELILALICFSIAPLVKDEWLGRIFMCGGMFQVTLYFLIKELA